MKFNFIIILIQCYCYKSSCEPKKYYNYTVYRGIPINYDHLNFFKNLSAIYNVNYWRPPGLLNKPTEFMIAPENKSDFVRRAQSGGIYYSTVIEDVQREFDKQTVNTYIRRNMKTFNWNSFYRLEDIYNWLRDLSKKYSKVMTIKSIGTTVNKRNIMAVIINYNPESKIKKPKVMVEGGIHAREWISPAFVTYFIHSLLIAERNINTTMIEIAKKFRWYFVPVVNPDGYEYTHTKDRLYRKNMNAVDLNRNFEIAFGSVGISFQQSSEIFCGHAAFSEPETQAMRRFIKINSRDLKYYFAFHSYGQYIILPYTHMRQHVENYNTVRDMGLNAARAIFRRYGTQYAVGTAYDTVGYMTSGVSGCWAKKTYHIPYVVTFELRDQGKHGFALPPSQILPTCKETMDGIRSLLTPSTHQELRKVPPNAQISTDLDMLVVFICLFIILCR
ncbi:zinc carboxypeptidase-like [Leptidea sinapis]|uniref:zinc carboxypeptidase-like n=1 Tax=Leptidea sinapis TaxID=189913 RepID=UPI00213C8B85|nr:zinc carboxypeptidase-like [Leptidea sinapis]